MTDDEFNDTYRDVELVFDSYYKYDFTFKGTAPDGAKIVATFGGNPDDIYHYDISHNSKKKLGTVDQWMSIGATLNGSKIYDYYDG